SASGEGSRFEWRRVPGGEPDRAARAEGTAGELEYDYEDSQVPFDLVAGARIVHPRFGAGRIVSVRGSGRDAKAEIDFDEVGPKKVLVAYAGLRPA
ncbi:MAG: hypothetical protein ACRELC_07090, partial [Gemmatimonadota bacterium]